MTHSPEPTGDSDPETSRASSVNESHSAASKPARRRTRLNTVGELVEAGGNRGALGILAYLVIGTAFWSLVGFLLDNLVGTQWLVLLGAGIGLAAGITLAYLHLQAALDANDGPKSGDDARNHPADRRRRDDDRPAGGSRKDRH